MHVLYYIYICKGALIMFHDHIVMIQSCVQQSGEPLLSNDHLFCLINALCGDPTFFLNLGCK